MSDPKVCAVMLVNGREQMVERAVASFRAQTYKAKRLVAINSGDDTIVTDAMRGEFTGVYAGPKVTVGVLRNGGNHLAKSKWEPDILIHFDSDDYSNPRRIEEQVALLQASGKQCVGYNEALFWDTRCQPDFDTATGAAMHESYWQNQGDAWIYSNPDPRYVLGASMCYWRSAWEACPFDDAPHEDQRWWLKNASKCKGVSALWSSPPSEFPGKVYPFDNPVDPRIICQIHGANTSAGYSAEAMASQEWRRAPEFDAHANVMVLPRKQ